MSNSINLAVPFYSQRENPYVWKQKYENDTKVNKITHKKGSLKNNTKALDDCCCNISCLAMILKFLGITQDTPYEMCRKIFADDFNGLNTTVSDITNSISSYLDFDRYIKFRQLSGFSENYGYRCIENPNVMASIAKNIYKVRNFYVGYNYKLTDVLNEVRAGYPVIINCGIVMASSEYIKSKYKKGDTYYDNLMDDSNYEYHGHYIVVKGVTENGSIIINDPWGKSTNSKGKLPTQKIDDKIVDAWGAYTTNISEGSNFGENIIISQSDFNRQWKDKFHTILVIYDRRWSFPLKDCMINFTTVYQNNKIRFTPNLDDYNKCLNKQALEIHYPIASTGTSHNGIHLNVSKGTPIHSIGSGMIVAAKLFNKETEIIENGSNCFVLVRHQVLLSTKPFDLKTFFVLYNHLRPVKEETELIDYPYINELKKEMDRDYYYKSAIDTTTKEKKKNILQDEAKIKYEKILNGDIVVFNDGQIISEISEGELIGYAGEKGFSKKDIKNCVHFEIFSNVNIFTKKNEYKLIFLNNIDHYNRYMVIKKFKDVLFESFSKDDNYKKYTKHLDDEDCAIAPEGINKFYLSEYKHIAEKIVLNNKSEWAEDRNFKEEYSDKKRRGFPKIDGDINNFIKTNIKPHLWWNNEIDTAINKDLKPIITNKTAFYYHPIDFLYFLMINDDDIYEQISPKLLKKELEEFSKIIK